MSFLIWCSVPTVTALCNHTTFAKNREAQLVPHWSDDDKRLMIIRTHEPENLYCKNPTVYKHRVIREYPDSGCYVYEQDTSFLGPSRFLSWRRVKSFGSHSLFLRLNYPINLEITVGQHLDGREALFAMENCVYTASPRSSGENSPDCQWYSLQPKEGEPD